MPTYAIIESGGKQYRVAEGTKLLVDRVGAAEGEKVLLRPVAFRGDGDGGLVADFDSLEKVKVEATVAEHVRGPKIRIFKHRPKKGYRKRGGHRSELSKLEVTEVKLLTRKPAAKKTEAAEKPAAKTKVAEKPAAKTQVAKKPAAAKTQVAKKPAAKKAAEEASE